MPIYKIAGLYVEMDPRGTLLKAQAEPYLAQSSASPDFSIKVRDGFVEKQVENLPNLSYDEGEYLVYGAIFYHKLIDNSGFLLHSSAVVYEGKAYMFSGPCGSGKSTHASLWIKHFGPENAFIINDDKPAIRLIDNKFHVFGTPFSGKTNISKNTSAPPAAVCFVEQGSENRIRKLSVDEAIPLLLEQTTYSVVNERGDALFSLLDKFLQTTNVYKLTCTISDEAVEIAYNEMSQI